MDELFGLPTRTGQVLEKGVDVMAAPLLWLGSDAQYLHVAGTTSISALSPRPPGVVVALEFDASLTLVHNATTFMLQGKVNLTTVAGDVVVFLSEGNGTWRQLGHKIPVGEGGTGLSSLGTARQFLKVNQAATALVYQSDPVVNVKDYGATGDGRVVQDAAMTSGSATLTSATAAFVAGDVGKLCSIAGAGAAGADLATSISAFLSATQVTLAVAASTTVSGKAAAFGTSDLVAINNAIAAAEGGTVIFPAGTYCVNDAINATNLRGLRLLGAGQSVNTQAIAGTGVRILPMTPGQVAVLDLVGSYAVTLKTLQIGTQPGPIAAFTGILMAQKSGSAASNFMYMENVFVTGRYTVAAWYNYGVPSSSAHRCAFYQYQNSQYTVYLGRDNLNGASSPYQTIATGEQAVGDWTFTGCEFHNNATTPGPVFRLRGFWRVRFLGGNWEIASAGATEFVTFETVTATNDFHVFAGVEFNGSPTNVFNRVGDAHNLTLLQNRYGGVTDANIFGGAGLILDSAGSHTPVLQFHTTIDTTLPAGSTNYLGAMAHSATEVNASGAVSGRSLIDRLDVLLTASPTGVETVIATLMKNGSATSITVTITGAASVGNDAVHNVVVVPGDRVSLRVVLSAGAAVTQVLAAVRLNPF